MKISEIICRWYENSQRDLPWRGIKDPYRIWISEIILQQTRVDQGLPYYISFVEEFPKVADLASADEQKVLKLWQGLGYYSRARNMLYAAKQVMNEFGGVFPSSYRELIKLKGVGTYTAAAVASFSSGEAVAVVDGNVSRVLSRLFAVEEEINVAKGLKVIQGIADEILDPENSGDHNQAIMEFGALQCVPVNPVCDECVLIDLCEANKLGQVKEFPRKQKKLKVKNRYFNYVVIRSEKGIPIHKRTANDVWREMFEFPMFESKEEVKELDYMHALAEYLGVSESSFRINKISDVYKHVLSHRRIYARFVHVELISDYEGGNHWLWVPEDAINDYPVSRLIEKYLAEISYS